MKKNYKQTGVKTPDRGNMILTQNHSYSLDCYKTQLNNNVLVVGTSGSGKTRSIVSPNILEAKGSYIISDPKGNLYGQYAEYLRYKGYKVMKLDFTNPGDTKSSSYNFFKYLYDEQDILRVAHMLIKNCGVSSFNGDPFWDDASELLMTAIISYLYFHAEPKDQNLHSILTLLDACELDEDSSRDKTVLDLMFEDIDRNEFASRTYHRFRLAAGRTIKSILITITSKIGRYDTPALQRMLGGESINIARIGERKTALFVVVSDTDRSMDTIANMFFTQAIQELCRAADARSESRLPIDVRFILDDFATNVQIVDFPRMIASIRSRGISTMLLIQSEAQLARYYKEDAKTIISNCDTYVYLGGNDLETAKSVARRANVPLEEVLYMPVGTNWIFRRGERPIKDINFALDKYQQEVMGECREEGLCRE